ncbi:MAG: DUF3592 domain-containing protein [Ruminococcus sp.]|nr:DUF3592 domain-containing protein [Ruminococcus sp.]
MNNTNEKPMLKSGCGCITALLLVFILGSFTIVPMICAGIGAFYLSETKKDKEMCTISVTAVVEENATVINTRRSTHSHSSTSSRSYAPVYKFEYNGKKYLVQSSSSSKPAKYDVGDEVEIMINSDNPTQIYEPDNTAGEKFAFIITIVGAVGSVIMVIIFISVVLGLRKAKIIVKNPNETDMSQL